MWVLGEAKKKDVEDRRKFDYQLQGKINFKWSILSKGEGGWRGKKNVYSRYIFRVFKKWRFTKVIKKCSSFQREKEVEGKE